MKQRYVPVTAALLAVALCLPALWLGWQNDDYVHRAALVGVDEFPQLRRSPATMFAFMKGDRQENRKAIDDGILPWWSTPDLRLAFFRPVTGLTHWLDYRLWPERAWTMHAQSLLWLGGTVLAAALLYRRMMGATAVAGLAALLFAIDDGHGLPAFWIANRNATVAAFFGVWALLAYHSWRARGRRLAAVLSPLMLLAALMSSESGVGAGGYLLAYALFVDNAPRRSRMIALMPCALVGAFWMIAYKLGGYGAHGSAVYVDPAASPLRYAGAVVERLPTLILGQWAVPPSELSLGFSVPARRILWLAATSFAALMVVVLTPMLRRDPMARFWATGMVLALLPVCATFPSDRLLLLAGLGGMALVAKLMLGAFSGADWTYRRRGRARALQIGCVVLGIIHLLIAPIYLLTTGTRLMAFNGPAQRLASTLPNDEEFRRERVIVVNSPTQFFCGFASLERAFKGGPIARHGLVLGSGIGATEILRANERTLVVRPDGGYLAPPGTVAADAAASLPMFDLRYILPVFDRLFCDDGHPFHAGQRIDLSHVTIEITKVNDQGMPAEAAFHFKIDLDDAVLRWLKITENGYAPFELPDVGTTIRLPSVPILQ